MQRFGILPTAGQGRFISVRDSIGLMYELSLQTQIAGFSSCKSKQ
jgi:hypothetical protein